MSTLLHKYYQTDLFQKNVIRTTRLGRYLEIYQKIYCKATKTLISLTFLYSYLSNYVIIYDGPIDYSYGHYIKWNLYQPWIYVNNIIME